jgi:signal transduction histidine kinase
MTGTLQAKNVIKMESRPSNFAHDMNNCLMSISGFAELILTANADDPQLKVYAEKIFRQSQRGFGLIQQLKQPQP